VGVLQLSIHLPWGTVPAIAKMAGIKELRQVAQAVEARTLPSWQHPLASADSAVIAISFWRLLAS
jgi:hypothetical protein